MLSCSDAVTATATVVVEGQVSAAAARLVPTEVATVIEAMADGTAKISVVLA